MQFVDSEYFVFFKEKTVVGDSNTFYNGRYKEGAIEIKGTATSFSVKVYAGIDSESTVQWTELMTINLSDFSNTDDLTSKGLYSIGCSGLPLLRVSIISVTGGNLTITGKFVG